LLSVLAALTVPAVILLVGLIAAALEREGLRTSSVALGQALSLPVPGFLRDDAAFRQLAWLVAMAVGLGLLFAVLIWLIDRGINRRSRAVVDRLYRRILERSIRGARLEGATAQRRRVEDLIETRLPQLRQGLIAWWRAVPRTIVLLIAGLTIALLIDAWLAILAALSGFFVWRFAQWLHADEALEVTSWEISRARQRLIELIQQAPLLSHVQSSDGIQQIFDEELLRLQRRQARLDAVRGRAFPLVVLAGLLSLAVLVLAMGIHFFLPRTGLGFPAALVLILSLGTVASSAAKLRRTIRRLGPTREAAATLYHYLEGIREEDFSEHVGIKGLRDAVELNHVTLEDNAGLAILSSLTLRLEPGSVVALLGSDPLACQSLAELLLGFGAPRHGTVTIDGLPIEEIHPRSLSRQVLWIGPEGPIWPGTIRFNLVGPDSETDQAAIMAATRQAGIQEALNHYEEGLETRISADDAGLTPALRYGMGIARALLRRPAIVVVQELDPEPNSLDGHSGFAALQSLAREGTLVVILPRRLQSLRQADRVVLFNGSLLAGEGKHESLLTQSDLYRHLNYLLFNPYRHRQPDGR